MISKILFFSTLVIAFNSFADSLFMSLKSPRPEQVSLQVESQSFSSKKAKHFSDEVERKEFQTSLIFPFSQPEDKYRKTFRAEYEHKEFNFTNRSLNSPLPNSLQRLSLNQLIVDQENKLDLYGVLLGVESASDILFESGRDVNFSATAFRWFDTKEHTSWILSLNFSTLRDIIGDYIPLPGFQYVYVPGRQLFLILGVPMNGVIWRPLPFIQLNYFSIIYNQNLRVSYFFNPVQELYLKASYQPESFRISKRPNKDKELFIENKNVSLGFKTRITSALSLDIHGGKLFDYKVYQAEGFGDRRDWIEEVQDQYYFNIQFGISI